MMALGTMEAKPKEIAVKELLKTNGDFEHLHFILYLLPKSMLWVQEA